MKFEKTIVIVVQRRSLAKNIPSRRTHNMKCSCCSSTKNIHKTPALWWFSLFSFIYFHMLVGGFESWIIQTYRDSVLPKRSFVCDAQDWYVLVSLVRIIKNIIIPPWSYNLLNLIRRYVYNEETRRRIRYHILCIHFVCYHFHPRDGWCVVRSMDMQILDRRRHHKSWRWKERVAKLEEGTFILLASEIFLKIHFQVHILFSPRILLEHPKDFLIETIITNPLGVVLRLRVGYVLSIFFSPSSGSCLFHE